MSNGTTANSLIALPVDRTERCVTSRLITFRQGNIHWIAQSEVVDQLFPHRLLDIERRLQDGSASVVKTGRHRTVFRLTLPCGNFYLKHYRISDVKALLQNCIRPSKAVLEWSAIRTVSQAGIPTVEPIALGRRQRGPLTTDSFLVTRAIDRTETLHEYVTRLSASSQRFEPQRRQALAVTLGRLVAKLHSSGLIHRDLHAGNILVRDEQNESQMWVIDLHAVNRHRRLPLRRIATNLALLNHFFRLHATCSDRLRFFESYHRGLRGDSGIHGLHESLDASTRRGDLQLIERACRRWSGKALRKADEKWCHGHRKLVIIETDSIHCRGVAELGAEFVRQVGREPDILRQSNGWQGLERSEGPGLTGSGPSRWSDPATRLGFETASIEPDVRIMTGPVEETVHVEWLGRRRDWTPGRIRWEFSHALLRRGIPVPRPLLFAEELTGPRRMSYSVTEFPPNCRPFEFVRSDSKTRRAFLRQSSRLLRRLHEQQLIHTRLSPTVFLACGNAESESASQVILDQIEAVRTVRRKTRAVVIRQLALLNESIGTNEVSAVDRLRFLQTYLGKDGASLWKSTWREIARSSNASDADPAAARRRFLKAAVATAGLFLGCRTPKQTVLTRPVRHSIQYGRLVVYSNFKLKKNDPVITDLVLLRKQIITTLQLPAQKEDVAIYIFSTEKEFRDYFKSTYPALPHRRAFFIGDPTSGLAVYTYWGERIQEDLRHEYTHGLLHASLRAVPLWLDEGLAEYFEVAGPRPGTVNTEYAGRLAASVSNGWRPDMAALENLEQFSKMQHVHYQESWAWVHFLLHSSDGTRQVLLDYLHDLRTQSRPRTLSQRLHEHLPTVESRFIAHVSTLQSPQMLRQRRVIPANGTAR